MNIAPLLAAALAIAAETAPAVPPRNLVILDLTSLSKGRLDSDFAFLSSSAAVFDAAVAPADQDLPSLASILTSEYAGTHQLLGSGQNLSSGTAVLPEILAQAGFKTAAFASVGAPADLSRGFELWRGETSFAKAADSARRWLERRRGERFFLLVRGGGPSDAEALRTLWGTLKSSGLLRRTIVVLLAQDGRIGSDAPARVPRVPFVVWTPGVRPHRISEIFSLIDAAPTALSLLGVASPPTFEGTDRSGLILSTGASPGAERFAFSASITEGARPEIEAYSVQDAGWEMIYERASGSFRLFDLARDPDETVDASEREPVKALELTQRLLRHIRRTRSDRERARTASPEILRQLREKGYW